MRLTLSLFTDLLNDLTGGMDRTASRLNAFELLFCCKYNEAHSVPSRHCFPISFFFVFFFGQSFRRCNEHRSWKVL